MGAGAIPSKSESIAEAETSSHHEFLLRTSSAPRESYLRRPSIVVAATFTADPVVDSLTLFMRETALGLDVVLSPYAQVFQALLDRSSLFFQNQNGVNVILVRFEDWVREASGEADLKSNRARMELMVDDLAVALREAASATTAPLVVCVCPPSPRNAITLNAIDDTEPPLLASLETRLCDEIGDISGVYLLPHDRLDALDPALVHDAESDRIGHLPYTAIFFATLGTALARLVHALKSTAPKVLVLDCDNTLWKGAVGEEGIFGVEITEQHRMLQRFVLAKKDQGMVICLASKNVEADVLGVLRQRDDMILRERDIASMRVNWLSKSHNLKALAAELGLGIDSFVLMDDNPVECAEVEANCPGVLALRLPVNGDLASFLANVWPLDRIKVTDEDKRRTELYQLNRQRYQAQTSATNFAEFLSGLDLRIDINKARQDQLGRVAQLVERTNQFNLTTRRRTEKEIAQLANEGKECLVVEVKDRFGDYGLVGVVIFGAGGHSLIIDTMLLSCRVLGRGVEHAMLREIGALAKAKGLSHVLVDFVPTKKNLPAKAFLDHLEVDSRDETEGGTRYLLSSQRAARVVYEPGEVAMSLPLAETTAVTEKSNTDTAKSERWNVLASRLDTPDKVLAALDGAAHRARPVGAQLVAPRTETERKIAAIWAEELHVAQLGMKDDYFDLGGTSLLAVTIFARIERELGRRLPLTALLDSGTIEGLAARIDGAEVIHSSLVKLEEGGDGIPLFLVHDADGETLLYRSLAQRLGKDRPIYAIQPEARDDVPIAHTRIKDMAAHYVSEIRKVRPRGPYLLGGLCAGGIVAFEMATQLEAAHEEVRLIAVFDAADVDAALKPHLETRRRLDRLKQVLGAPSVAQMSRVLIAKAKGYVGYQLKTRVRRAHDRAVVAMLRLCLDRGMALPPWLRNIAVRTVYTYAEAEYRPQHVVREEIVLFRATDGVGPDEPYVHLYSDPLLGWGKRSAKGVRAVDIPGGHGSMLQEPHVAVVATVLRSLLGNDDRMSRAAS
jgi:FkbH-like protein